MSSLVLPKIDYCNSLFSGTSKTNIRSLQVLQNNAARLALKQKRQHEATPLLKELHWLPIEERIKYKVACLAYKCMEGSAPEYLTDLVTIYHPQRTLRSSCDEKRFKTPLVKLKAGEKCFSYSGPSVWNNLPIESRNAPSLEIFKRRLKTHLFGVAYGRV